MQVKRLSRNQVRSIVRLIEIIEEEKTSDLNVNRRGRSRKNDIFHGPAVQHRFGKDIDLRGGDVISQRGRKRVANIEVGRSSILVCNGGWPKEITRDTSRTCGGRIDRVCPRVRRERLETLRQPP